MVPGREAVAEESNYQSRQLLGEHESLAPMGALFEDICAVFLDMLKCLCRQSALYSALFEDICAVFLDGLIAELMARLEVSEASMREKHSTIE